MVDLPCNTSSCADPGMGAPGRSSRSDRLSESNRKAISPVERQSKEPQPHEPTDLRTWTDASGQHTVEAKIMAFAKKHNARLDWVKAGSGES